VRPARAGTSQAAEFGDELRLLRGEIPHRVGAAFHVVEFDVSPPIAAASGDEAAPVSSDGDGFAPESEDFVVEPALFPGQERLQAFAVQGPSSLSEGGTAEVNESWV